METPRIERCLPDCWVVGHGLLGSALAKRLRCAGARVLVLDAAADTFPDIVGDAAEPAVLGEARARLLPAVVYCCQATGGGDAAAYRRAYAEVVEQLAVQVPEARIVLCSSCSVYGAAEGAVDESTPAAASGERARVLLAAEAAVQGRGGAVARLVPLYGADRCEVLRRHLVGEPRLPGAESRMLNYLHVEDAVEALLLLGVEGAGGVYNVCGESLSKAELYAQLVRATGVAAVRESAGGSVRGVSNRIPDTARLRALGWRPERRLAEYAETKR